MGDVTQWIRLAQAGDAGASAQLYEAVYHDLRRLAAHMLRGTSPDQVRTTSLVHEAYMRLARPQALDVNDRRHFFAVAARAMRQLVLDRARHRAAVKRGADFDPLPLDAVGTEHAHGVRDADALALEQALTRLAAIDASLAELVELRFFGGLTLEEIGELHGRSERSLKRDWRKARAFLHAQLGGAGMPDDADA